jgi:hypothetical protein
MAAPVLCARPRGRFIADVGVERGVPAADAPGEGNSCGWDANARRGAGASDRARGRDWCCGGTRGLGGSTVGPGLMALNVD